ncbi:MAG: hypothetical protein M1839_003017 [Geoglossum umbratile]|nr:MAG: hypothetical protein M1839_003017 [Geoglossum umbratile]
MAGLSLDPNNTILPDTALAAIAGDDMVYTYVQFKNGQLAETPHNGTGSYDSSACTLIPNLYWGEVKLYTPLAAAFLREREKVDIGNDGRGNSGRGNDGSGNDGSGNFYGKKVDSGKVGGQKLLFYLDDQNYLHNLHYKNGQWTHGDLCGHHGHRIQCAHYSKLAATIVSTAEGDVVCVYYQTPRPEADLKVINRRLDGTWYPGTPDWVDPPLLGTSLAAVYYQTPRPEADLKVINGRHLVLGHTRLGRSSSPWHIEP